MPPADDYSWINETHLAEAACFAVVPAAERAAVLAAYGASEGSRVRGREGVDLNPFGRDLIQVVEVGEALLVIEDNGFQATRPEVLGPLSRASRTGVAAAFFWNVNAVTSFTAGRDGVVAFAVELLGLDDEDDDELEDVPAHLRALVVEGGSDDGDMLGAGLALVALHTATPFTAQVLDAGTWYEIEPPPAALRVRRPQESSYDPLSSLAGATEAITALPPALQRSLAEWATAAAVRESGMQGDPVLRQVLGSFGTGTPAREPDGLDQLARTTAREHDRFADVEQSLEWGGQDRPTEHPYYEAVVPGDFFGDRRAFSHLEGCYLAQRRWAVEAARQVTNPDPFTAAVECLRRADITFGGGRTTRGWTFEENAEGRWRRGTTPGWRREQLARVVTSLLAELASGAAGPDVWQRADAMLPAPLSDEERRNAIRADAEAAARGEFATYQVAHVDEDAWDDEDDEDDDELDWPVEMTGAHGGAPEDGVHEVLRLEIGELDGETWIDEMRRLDGDLRRHDAMLVALARPADVLAAITAAPTVPDAVDTLAAAFGFDREQSLAVLGLRFRRASREDVLRVQAQRDVIATRLRQLRSS